MYGAENPSIAGMVLDSPFSDLVELMMELVETYKFRLPKFTVRNISLILNRPKLELRNSSLSNSLVHFFSWDL